MRNETKEWIDYPGSILPDFTPDKDTCLKYLAIVKRIEISVKDYLQGK